MKNLAAIFICLLLLLAAAVLGYRYGERREVDHVERDTVYSERISVIADTVKKWIPKTDTVYVPVSDTLSLPVVIERLDTVLVHDRDSLLLNISRYPYPHVNYSLAYKFIKRDSAKTITEKIYLEKPESKLDRFNIGIGVGYSLYKDGSEVKAAPSVNLSVYYRLF